jgi:hypothetical protein
MNYVMRQGRRIEVETLNTDPPPKAKRKRFWLQFVQVPRHWITALQNTKSANTYRLAHIILWETFTDRHRNGGEVTLSATVTRGMSRATRARAVTELAELGLIQVLPRKGLEALRVKALL